MKHSERAPLIQAILLILSVTLFLLMVEWIIPTYFSVSQQETSIKNASYIFTAATTLIFAGQHIASFLDIRKSRA